MRGMQTRESPRSRMLDNPRGMDTAFSICIELDSGRTAVFHLVGQMQSGAYALFSVSDCDAGHVSAILRGAALTATAIMSSCQPSPN